MKQKEAIRFIVLLAAVCLLQSCAAGTRLSTGPAAPSDLKGATFSLLLYGCRYPSDIKNLAILIPETAPYPIEVYDLPTSQQVKKALPVDQALREADSFVRCGGIRRVSGTRMSRIEDQKGTTVGYEVRALYFPLEMGRTDVLLTSYSLMDGTVRAYVQVDPDVERSLESSGSDRHNGR